MVWGVRGEGANGVQWWVKKLGEKVEQRGGYGQEAHGRGGSADVMLS